MEKLEYDTYPKVIKCSLKEGLKNLKFHANGYFYLAQSSTPHPFSLMFKRKLNKNITMCFAF